VVEQVHCCHPLAGNIFLPFFSLFFVIVVVTEEEARAGWCRMVTSWNGFEDLVNFVVTTITFFLLPLITLSYLYSSSSAPCHAFSIPHSLPSSLVICPCLHITARTCLQTPGSTLFEFSTFFFFLSSTFPFLCLPWTIQLGCWTIDN